MSNEAHEDSHTGIKDHILRKPLEKVLSNSDGKSSEEIAEELLVALNERGLIQYAPKGTLSLMSAPGRVLVCLMENPSSTMREIAVRLGVTEANVGKNIAHLAECGLITRTKVNNKYRYKFVAKALKEHPDIQRFYNAISKHLDETL